MSFKHGIIQFIHGLRDSYYGCYRFLLKQKAISASLAAQSSLTSSSSIKLANKYQTKLHQRIIQSCILNGLFLLLCILIFNYLLMPFLNWIVYKILSENNYYYLIHNYVNSIIYLLFSFIWIMPVFLLSKMFNIFCYQDIADIAYMNKYGKPKLYQESKLSLIITDTLFSCILEVIFLVQSSLMLCIPINGLNQILFHLHISLLYSLYAFEYKWFNMNWNILKRLNYIETKWPYYFGFGLSLSIITSIPSSYILSATLFAFLFPAIILSAIEADCQETRSTRSSSMTTQQQQQQQVVNNQTTNMHPFDVNFTSMHLFDVSVYITDRIFRLIEFFKNRKK